MTPTQMAITLPLATVTTLLTVVACGPNQGSYTPVKVHAGSNVFSTCSSEITTRTTVKIAAKNQTTGVCKSTSDDPEKPAYALKETPVRYELGRSGDKVKVEVLIALEVPDGLSKYESDGIGAVIAECAPRISDSLSLSNSGKAKLDTTVQIKLVPLGGPKSEDVDYNIVTLSRLTPNSFALAAWPKGSQLLLSKNVWPRELYEANRQFCKSMAKMTGHLLGLTAEDQRCSDAKNPKVQMTNGFMKSVIEEEPNKFFDGPKISASDITTILSRACLTRKP
ncbi:MAG: hypothetical protein V4692_14130 [Bdellovibrionota bacterium]